ncbi:hypothetical protein pb186bvf_014800 [Paramecium bursaria]
MSIIGITIVRVQVILRFACFDPKLYKRYFKSLKHEFTRFEDLNDHFLQSFFPKIIKSQQMKWHDFDKYILIWLVISLVETSGINNFISLEKSSIIKQISEIIYFDEDFIRQKLYSLMNWKVKLDPWDNNQVDILKQIIKKQDVQGDWVAITLEFNKVLQKVRYPKQLRERWNNVSNPQINKEPFNIYEDIKLMDAIKLIPEQQDVKKLWSQIRKLVLNYRNDNQIKIRFHKIIKTIAKEMGLNFKDDDHIYKIVKGIKGTNSFDAHEIKEYYRVKAEYEDEDSSRMPSFQQITLSSYACQPKKKIYYNNTTFSLYFFSLLKNQKIKVRIVFIIIQTKYGSQCLSQPSKSTV